MSGTPDPASAGRPEAPPSAGAPAHRAATFDAGHAQTADEAPAFRSGFCAIVGRPNVGKSTLLNALVGEAVAITTPVPQTTRHAVRGVRHRDDLQIVFVDTPGLHKPRTLLGDRLNDLARETLSDVDVLLFLVDAAAGIGRGDRFVADLLAAHADRTIAVVNKVDRIRRAEQLPALAAVDALGDWAEIVPVSALTGEGVDVVAALIAERMPAGPPWFPSGQVTDQTLEQRIAEHIREQAIVRMREEVPHSVAVRVDEIVSPDDAAGDQDAAGDRAAPARRGMGAGRAADRSGAEVSAPGVDRAVTSVYATIYVERDSQKGIVIGRRGSMLRDIGSHARPVIERLLGSRVYLDLRVKLLKDWQGDPRALRRLGY